MATECAPRRIAGEARIESPRDGAGVERAAVLGERLDVDDREGPRPRREELAPARRPVVPGHAGEEHLQIEPAQLPGSDVTSTGEDDRRIGFLP